MVTDKTRRSSIHRSRIWGWCTPVRADSVGEAWSMTTCTAQGCVGLIKAYDNFDESRGVCFSTYAVPVILGEIKKLFRDGGTVKVSRSLKELGMRVQAAREHHHEAVRRRAYLAAAGRAAG